MNTKLLDSDFNIKSSSNEIVLDLVHFIDLRDIQKYVINKHKNEAYTTETTSQMNAELTRLCNELKGQGYEIVDYEALRTTANELAKKLYKDLLSRDTAKLRHEVGVLSKKLSKVQEVLNAKI